MHADSPYKFAFRKQSNSGSVGFEPESSKRSDREALGHKPLGHRGTCLTSATSHTHSTNFITSLIISPIFYYTILKSYLNKFTINSQKTPHFKTSKILNLQLQRSIKDLV